jgi:hypothetical protein
MIGCVLAGALGTSCGDIHVVPADGGAGTSGGGGGRGGGGPGGAAGNAAGMAGTGSAGAAGVGVSGAGGGGRGGGTGGNAAGTAGTGAAGTAGTGSAGAGGGGRGGGAGGSAAGAGGTGATGAGAGGRGGGGVGGNTAGAAGMGSAGAAGSGGGACRRELLTNGDFDLGVSPWSEAPLGTRLVRRFDDAEVASHQITPQSGLYVLRLGAPSNNSYVVHYVEQYATIPSGALEITVSGQLQIRTEEPPDDVYDEAYLQLFDEAQPASPVFRSAPRWSNLTQASNWTPFSFPVNVASVAGKQMVFRITADLDTSVPTYFYFDMLSVAVTRCSP